MNDKLRKIAYRPAFKDFLCILAFILTYCFIFTVTTRAGTYIFGSTTDFDAQHYTLPDYLRTLFYETGDLFPDFSFNLGGGQNIYAVSYYGLLNPIFLLSYLLPFVDMLTYTIVAMSVVVIASSILFYYFLRKNNYSRPISFLCAYFLLCASPFIFHSHRHIMFISYMPFLILGFYGMDRFIKKRKSLLLILSIVLMIFTSYYFSIPGMIALFVYGLFQYVRIHGFAIKKVFDTGFRLIPRFLAAVLVGTILILPTLYVLFSGRSGSGDSVGIISLLLPNMYMLYGTYSMGLTLVCLIATVFMVFSKRIENKILSVFLLLISVFPIFNYVLNAFLYVNSKVLIPFIPLVLINTADFFEIVFPKLKNVSTKRYTIATAYLLLASIALGVCAICNQTDTLMTKEETYADFEQSYADSVDTIVSEDGQYRINSSLAGKIYINKVIDAKEYKTTLYSSTFHHTYREVYRNLFQNPLNYRNEFIISSDGNLIFQMYMAEKYVYSTVDPGFMYEEVETFDDITLYQNPYVLPIGYATTRTISQEDFSKLSYPDNMLSLLGNAVTEGKNSTTSPLQAQKVQNIPYTISENEDLKVNKTKNGYSLKASDTADVSIQLQDLSLIGKVLFISFDLTAADTDLSITVNGIENLLTDRNWKYYNQNENFAYVIANRDNRLDFTFTKGEYEIQNISVSALDFNQLKDISQTVDPFVIDTTKTKSDTMVGTIKVQEDSCFVLSVPYDEGFTILIDGKETEYYTVNEAFIGFDIATGFHQIEIQYHAPYKSTAAVLSIVGIGLCIGIVVYEKRKKKEKWN